MTGPADLSNAADRPLPNRVTAPAGWSALLGQEVVLDLASRFVCVGRLEAAEGDYLLLVAADVHDLRDTSTTRERYVRDCVQHGVNPNRQRTWIRLAEVVAISRLADVVVE